MSIPAVSCSLIISWHAFFINSSFFSFINSEVDEVIVRGAGSVKGSEMVQAPNFSLNGLICYQATEQLSMQVDFNHLGEQYFDITNSDISKEDAYTVFNARVGYSINENLTVSAFIKNLTEEEYRVYNFDFTAMTGYAQNFYGKPRWAGISVNYSFD